MALTEKVEIDRIEVVNQWIIQVRRNTTIERDGEFVSNSFHRWVLTPDSDISDQEQKVKTLLMRHGHPKLKPHTKHLRLNKPLEEFNPKPLNETTFGWFFLYLSIPN